MRAATVSPATGKPYGVRRVCSLWSLPRSTFYEQKERLTEPPAKRKPGPVPDIDDAALLILIHEDLANSPFVGEGHRKVWARLKFAKGVSVSPKRVLRLMRQNNLLSPHRQPQGKPDPHDGTIITKAPNLMWGTDAAKIFTLEDGWVWLFTAVEHWNAEVMGWYLSKHGDRHAALEPIMQGLERCFGNASSDCARGLSLRMDHGSQYLSDHFQNQLRYWGIASSFAFVQQPQTNGVVERFNKTLKQQVVYGRYFNSISELKTAISTFIDNYNQHWRFEKMGFKSPREVRTEWLNKNGLDTEAA